MARGGYRPGAGRKPNPNRPIRPHVVKRPMVTLPAEPKAQGLDGDALAAMLPAIEEISRRYRAHGRPMRTPDFNPFKLPRFPDAAMPKPEHRMAMDSALAQSSTVFGAAEWGSVSDYAAEGLVFLGYSYLSELAQRPEYRTMAETIADDATRRWIDFDVVGDEKQRAEERNRDPEGYEERMADPDEMKKRVVAAGKEDRVKELKDDQERLEVQQRLHWASTFDSWMGRSHLYLQIGDADFNDINGEMATSIGNGRDESSKTKVGKDRQLKRIQTVEPIWAYPMDYDTTNPLAPTWYNPQQWFVMGRNVHISRLQTLISRPVPDILKPSYAFGGLPLTQIAKPYVDIWLQTRQSVADLIKSFSIMVLLTDLQTQTAPGNATNLLARVALFNMLRDNQGAFVVNKNTEDFKNVSAPLSGLHELQAQSQEHMLSVSRIPAVKFTGIQPAGLNASSEGEIKVYDDTIEAYQKRVFDPTLTRIINFQMLSLFGEVDPQITHRWEQLRQLTDDQKADQAKKEADRDAVWVEMGAISPAEVRKKIIDDEDSPYAGLDPDDVPEPPAQPGMGEEDGGEPPGEGDDPPTARQAADSARIAAGIVFRLPDGRVLLVRRSQQEANYAGHWALPGGGADEGETAAQCAMRESLEEIGREVNPQSLRLLDKVTTPNGMVYSTFLVDVPEAFDARLNAEHSASDWFHPSRLPEPVHPAVKRVLKRGGGANDAALPFGFAFDAWNEADHPRKLNGQFGSGGASAESDEHIGPVVRVDKPTTVYRVVPQGRSAREAFGSSGAYVFTKKTDAAEFQDATGGIIYAATLAPHDQQRVDDFTIEMMHKFEMGEGDPTVFGNSGESDVYEEGTQLYVRDPALLSTFSKLGRKPMRRAGMGNDEFREEDHPRDQGGKFTAGSGSTEPEKKPNSRKYGGLYKESHEATVEHVMKNPPRHGVSYRDLLKRLIKDETSGETREKLKQHLGQAYANAAEQLKEKARESDDVDEKVRLGKMMVKAYESAKAVGWKPAAAAPPPAEKPLIEVVAPPEKGERAAGSLTGQPGIASGDWTSAGEPSTELGRWRSEEQARLIAWGREHGKEDLGLWDVARNRPVSNEGLISMREAKHVGFTEELQAMLMHSGNNLELHHNHPSDSSFSKQDLFTMANSPGMSRMYAHGHAGSTYVCTGADMDVARYYDEGARAGSSGGYATLTKHGLTADEGNRLYSHAVMVGLDAAGAIRGYACSPGAELAGLLRTKGGDGFVREVSGLVQERVSGLINRRTAALELQARLKQQRMET